MAKNEYNPNVKQKNKFSLWVLYFDDVYQNNSNDNNMKKWKLSTHAQIIIEYLLLQGTVSHSQIIGLFIIIVLYMADLLGRGISFLDKVAEVCSSESGGLMVSPSTHI